MGIQRYTVSDHIGPINIVSTNLGSIDRQRYTVSDNLGSIDIVGDNFIFIDRQ